MLFWLAACVNSNDDGPSDGSLPETPAIVSFELTTPNANAPLVRRLVVETAAPSTLAVELDSGDHRVAVSFPGEATRHQRTLLGLKAGREYQVTATLTLASGALTHTEATTTAGPWPHLPVADIEVHDAGRRQPGHTMLPLRCAGQDCGEPNETVLVVDEMGEIVYLLSVNADTNDTMQDAIEYDGGILALVGTTQAAAIHFAWDGTELARWSVGAIAGGTTPIASTLAHSMHHDIVPHPLTPETFLAIGRYRLNVPNYPASYDEPEQVAESSVADDVALEFTLDGSVTREMKVSDYIPTSRIAYNSLDEVVEGWRDWAHANAIVLDPTDGNWILSLRHQDAVMKIDPDVPGAIVWIAGYHDNWPPEFSDVLLAPIGSPFAWQYHQHAPLIVDDGRGIKTLMLFDNGNVQTAPYSGELPLFVPPEGVPLPPGLRSRIVAYTIDEKAMTISQAWEFAESSVGPLFSELVGDVDVLENGNVLSNWGFLQTQPSGQPWYGDVGLGEKAVRVIEFDPVTLDEVWHIHLTVDAAFNSAGISAYRAERIPSLSGRIVD